MEAVNEEVKEALDAVNDLISDGRIDDAKDSLRELLKAHPDAIEVYSTLCSLYVSTGETEIPKEWILNTLRDDPSFSKSLIELCSRLYQEERFKESLGILEALVWSDPNNHEAWNDLGVVYFAMNDLITAEKAFGQALALKPGYSESVLNLTILYLMTSRTTSAVRTAVLALDDRSDASPAVLRELAGIIRKLGPNESIRLLRKAQGKADEITETQAQ